MDKKRLEIDITLSKETGIFNEFNNNQLSDDLSNYIYSSCKGYSTNKNITINIFICRITFTARVYVIT